MIATATSAVRSYGWFRREWNVFGEVGRDQRGDVLLHLLMVSQEERA